MRIGFTSTGIHVIIAIALMIGLVLSPGRAWAAHDPLAQAAAEASRHAAVPAVRADHDHVHHDGADEERLPGHAHGHNPADHSHDTPALFCGGIVLGRSTGPDWHPTQPVVPIRARAVRLDRPPRPIVVA